MTDLLNVEIDKYSNRKPFVKLSGPQTPNTGGFESINFSRIISHCYSPGADAIPRPGSGKPSLYINIQDTSVMQPKFDTAQTLPESTPLVFIDAGVENAEQLIEGVISTAEVFLLEKMADGVEQISRVLQGRRNVGAVHIISHGAPGCLYLGDGELSLDTLNRYAPQLRRWGVDNLLLYGCKVAAGDAGEEFVAKLHQLTGAEIAASKSLTGAALKGGNWELEVRTGRAELAEALTPEAMGSYRGVLNTILEAEPNNTIAAAQFLNPGDFSLTFNADIQALDGTNISTTIPHVSISGTGDGTFDYYRFNAEPGTWRFDIDDNNFDTELFLYDTSGNLLAQNDDDIETGHTGGSLPSYITHDFSAGGYYVIGVGRYNSSGEPGGITGIAPEAGDTYTLHISGGLAPINAPTDLTLDVNSIDENVVAGAVVGTFSTTDP
ncbi:MAG: DVUA0089 family protein, partial [Limnospira sp.]